MFYSLFRPHWLLTYTAVLSLLAGGGLVRAEELAALLVRNKSNEPVSIRIVTHLPGKPILSGLLEMPGGTTERALGYVPAESRRLFTGALGLGENVVYVQPQGAHSDKPEKAYTLQVKAGSGPAAVGDQMYPVIINDADLGLGNVSDVAAPQEPGMPDFAAAQSVLGELHKVHEEAMRQHGRLDCTMAEHDVDGLWAEADALFKEIEAANASLPQAPEQQVQEITSKYKAILKQIQQVYDDDVASFVSSLTHRMEKAAEDACQGSRPLQEVEAANQRAQKWSADAVTVNGNFTTLLSSLRRELAELRQMIAAENPDGLQAGDALKPKIADFRRRWSELETRGRRAAAVANENHRIQGVIASLSVTTGELLAEIARILSGVASPDIRGFTPPAKGQTTWTEAVRLRSEVQNMGETAYSCAYGAIGTMATSERAQRFITRYGHIPSAVDKLEQASMAGRTFGAVDDTSFLAHQIGIFEKEYAPIIAGAENNARNLAARSEQCLKEARKSDEEREHEAIARHVTGAEAEMKQCHWDIAVDHIRALPEGSSERQRLEAELKRLITGQYDAHTQLQTAIGQENGGQLDAALTTLRAAQAEPACATTITEIAAVITRVEGKIAQACAAARSELSIATTRSASLQTRLGALERDIQARQQARASADIHAQARALAAESYSSAGQVVEAKQQAEAAERQACDAADRAARATTGAVRTQSLTTAAAAVRQVETLRNFAADAVAKSAAATRKLTALRAAAQQANTAVLDIVSVLDPITTEAAEIGRMVALAENAGGTTCAAELQQSAANVRAGLAALDPRIEAVRRLAAPSGDASQGTAAIADAEADARASADTAEVFAAHIDAIAARTLACRDKAAAVAQTPQPAKPAGAGKTSCPKDMVQARDGSCVRKTDSASAIQMHDAARGQRSQAPGTSGVSIYGPRPGRISGEDMFTGMQNATVTGGDDYGGGGWDSSGGSGGTSSSVPTTASGSAAPTGGGATGGTSGSAQPAASGNTASSSNGGSNARQAAAAQPSSCQPQPSWVAQKTGAHPRTTHAIELGSGPSWPLVNEGGKLWHTDGTRYLIKSGNGYNYYLCGSHFATLIRTAPVTKLRNGMTLELGEMTFPKEPAKHDMWRLYSP